MSPTDPAPRSRFSLSSLPSLFRVFRRTPGPEQLTLHAVVAMSQVVIATGRMDDAAVQQIAAILTRLTGREYGPAQVMEMLQKLNPTAEDLAQVGQDLPERDREIVLEAALQLAVAKGEIRHPEYEVVSDLALRMQVGAEAFRRAVRNVSAHFQTMRAA
ncbi:TerB family tellurite resistance protein [Thalassorhabdomicrobium marinisediminis]|uniref:TerB family tellurite resistance protein n=1 Tax=Thalassorhabdomicrobium marinisediminis TaxID=2170577 RepID=UPI00248FA6EF|nr:TerB family tellurite resistance protein [Thalassorhabdomicrobium marinisediminis]